MNANHLADAGLQFAHLVFGKPLYCVGGEMTFRHYVELGKPFTLTQLRVSKTDISIAVHQGGAHCTDITLSFSD